MSNTPDISTITLSRSIKIGGAEVSALTFRRMFQGDKRRAIKATAGITDDLLRGSDMNMHLATWLCLEGLTPETYDQLDSVDGLAVDTLMQSFLAPSLATTV